MKFEPAGMTDDPDLRLATSLLDYIFRRLALDYLSKEQRTELGDLLDPGAHAADAARRRGDGDAVGRSGRRRVEQRPERSYSEVGRGRHGGRRWWWGCAVWCGTQSLARAEQRDAPLCYNCGNHMQRAGSCYVCGSCGTTSGCS